MVGYSGVMSDIQFEEQEYARPAAYTQSKSSALSRMVISLGLAHDDAGAQKVLLVVLVITVILIGIVWFVFNPPAPSASVAPL